MEKYTPQPGSFLSREDDRRLNVAEGRSLAADWTRAIHGDPQAAARIQHWTDTMHDEKLTPAGNTPFAKQNEKDMLGEVQKLNPTAAKHLRDALISNGEIFFK